MAISNPAAIVRAKRLRQSSTSAEDFLWQRLRDRQFMGLKFRRQVAIGPYIADFYCHERRLVLELDGGIHHGERQRSHDENRDANLASLGYKILRFTNEEALEALDSVLGKFASTSTDANLEPLAGRHVQSPSSPGREGVRLGEEGLG